MNSRVYVKEPQTRERRQHSDHYIKGEVSLLRTFGNGAGLENNGMVEGQERKNDGKKTDERNGMDAQIEVSQQRCGVGHANDEMDWQ